ncbi:MAG: hypothetical protein PVI59_02200 [Anaerolineae bacterium]|jgi:hypothetical protein
MSKRRTFLFPFQFGDRNCAALAATLLSKLITHLVVAALPLIALSTATVDLHSEPVRWILLCWVASESRWFRTPTTLAPVDDFPVVRIYQPGKFVATPVAHRLWMPVTVRGGVS